MEKAEVIAFVNKEGVMRPHRVRFCENDEMVVLQIKRVLDRELQKVEKKKQLVFKCEATVGDCIKKFKLKYDIESCKWYIV